MQVLWLTQFDVSSNLEAVLAWARGLQQKEIIIDLVINNVPGFVKETLQNVLKHDGINFFLNINSQQLKNLLLHKNHSLMHVHHPYLFPFSANICKNLTIPWIATCHDEPGEQGRIHLPKAAYVICSSSSSLQAIKNLFPCWKQKSLLVAPAAAAAENIAEKKSLKMLYLSPLKKEQVKLFSLFCQVLKEAGVGLEELDILSWSTPTFYYGKHYSWDNVFQLSSIIKKYDVIIGYGYFLFPAMAEGKIVLITEDDYKGLFTAHVTEEIPAFRVNTDHPLQEKRVAQAIRRDIQKILDPSLRKKISINNWVYIKENHDPDVAAEKITRLYRKIAHRKG